MTTEYYLVTLINAYDYLKKPSKLILISYAADLTERARELSAVCQAHFPARNIQTNTHITISSTFQTTGRN